MNFLRTKRMWLAALLPGILSAQQVSRVRQKTADGVLEGVVSADGKVRTFKGIPYAAPPVGPLRWKPPQPVEPWTGVRPAADYGPRPMQGRIYSDMIFHDAGPSEDCLYLNLWMPAKPASSKLPVMVWIFGGGFAAGSTSEPRQDGGNLCKKGVVVVSLNYRLGVFGFFAHPGLAQESPHHASGNYGLLDQVAGLEWVRRNIATFGGDPDNVTIFGESAGSYSVSVLVASPLAHGLFRRAIGESGALLSTTEPLKTLAQAEAADGAWAQSTLGTTSLEKLRALPAQELLEASLKQPQYETRADIDGWFLPEDSAAIYRAGRQSHVPLLAGWNRDEGDWHAFFKAVLHPKATASVTNKAAWPEPDDEVPPTVDNYVLCAKALFGPDADGFLRVYPATTVAEAKRAAQDYEGDRFIAHATWRWLDLHLKTGGSPVYRYEFDQPLPPAKDAPPDAEPRVPHASDIEFVFRVLSSRDLPWTPEDHRVSELMASYWTNFAKTGDPNGPGLPEWPRYDSRDGYQVMHLQADPVATPDAHRAREEFLDHLGSAR